jgi:hypothetical protein
MLTSRAALLCTLAVRKGHGCSFCVLILYTDLCGSVHNLSGVFIIVGVCVCNVCVCMTVRAESGEDCECTQQSTVPERPPATIIVPRRSSHCIIGRRIILVWICMHTGRSRHTHTATAAASTATTTTKHDKHSNSRPQLHSKTVGG